MERARAPRPGAGVSLGPSAMRRIRILAKGNVDVRSALVVARVGGAVFPKQLQQSEAIGINYGPDGKPDTADDLNLGLVDVQWALEEYPATFSDDDVQFVGTLDQHGLFTPNLDGPNPKRSGNRNNVGDVWVVAELGGAKPMRARAHLLVTVPLYMNWFVEGDK